MAEPTPAVVEPYELPPPEPDELILDRYKFISTYFPDIPKGTLYREWSVNRTLLGESIAPGMVVGRRILNTLAELEDWRARVMHRLVSQHTDLGRKEPQAVK